MNYYGPLNPHPLELDDEDPIIDGDFAKAIDAIEKCQQAILALRNRDVREAVEDYLSDALKDAEYAKERAEIEARTGEAAE